MLHQTSENKLHNHDTKKSNDKALVYGQFN